MRNWNPLWSISLFTTRQGKSHLQGFQGKKFPYITVNNAMIAVANLLVRELNLLYGCRLLSQGKDIITSLMGTVQPFVTASLEALLSSYKMSWLQPVQLPPSGCERAVAPRLSGRALSSEGEWGSAGGRSMCGAARAGPCRRPGRTVPAALLGGWRAPCRQAACTAALSACAWGCLVERCFQRFTSFLI